MKEPAHSQPAAHVDLELYYTFYVTAKTGNISRAAKELFISQPAVSYSIKRLEEALGSPLFIRKPRGVELTEEASVLFEQVKTAFEMIYAAQENFVRDTHPVDHTIRLSSTEILSYFSPISFLQEFQSSYPRVRISLSNHGTPKAISMLKEGLLDLAVVTLPVPDMEGLKIHCTLPLHDCFVANEHFSHLAETPISLEELTENNPILLLRPGLNTRRFFDEIADSCGIHVRPQMELENIEALIRCADLGYGISFVVKEMVGHKLAEGRLFEIPLKEEIPLRSIGLCSREDLKDPEVLQFIDGFVKYVKENAASAAP